jgi:predicted enzyme related to lactoylglutathione lyase
MGWQASPMPIGDYDDYVMMSADGTSWGSGIRHLRGPNANQPANQWIAYFQVATLDDSIAQAESQGGRIVGDIRDAGPGSRFVIIEDPSGAKEALIEFQQP